jgi:hypothetical protein
LSDPADGDNRDLEELDFAEDELAEVQDRWFLEPNVPAPPPDTGLTDLAFLYRRYGFLTVEPTAVEGDVPKWSDQSARRIPGLIPDPAEERLDHLPAFISAILQGHLPKGHCDLSEDSPDDNRFPSSNWGVIDHIEPFREQSLSRHVLFMFEPRDGRVKILIHDPLTIAEMGRMRVQTESAHVIDYLLRNGSRFTVLAGRTEQVHPSNLPTLSFSLRLSSWVADVEDYSLYMSRLKGFLMDRPHVAAAALARGGIAWRITREVLGLDIDLIINGATFTGQAVPIQVMGSTQWCHAVDEQEWYYLVGGYKILTGTSFILTRPAFLINIRCREGQTNQRLLLVAKGRRLGWMWPGRWVLVPPV